MFENVISTLLNKVLGDFIDDVSSNQLNIGLWGGDVVLEKISIKKQALEKLKLPIDVKQGFLGKLVLKIPWKNLKTSPVQIILDDIFLVASPKFDRPYNREEEEEASFASKQKKLKELEDSRQQQETEASRQGEADFTTKLVAKIIDNLQLEIGKVHVRFEDTFSDPLHPFAIGLTLGGVKVLSANEEWDIGFVQESNGIIHKILDLNSLAIYLHTDSKSFANLSQEEFLSEADSYVRKSFQALDSDHQFLLKPISGGMKLRMDMRAVPPMDSPKAFVDLFFTELGFVLDDAQYETLFRCLDLFSNYSKKERYRQFRPPFEIKPQDNPRLWWKFAGDCILSEIRAKHERWSWKYLSQRRAERRGYINAFKDAKLNPKSVELKKEVEDFERRLDINDIVFYRSLALAEFKRENPNFGKSSGWGLYSWFGGGSKKADIFDLSDEEKAELYKTIDYEGVGGGAADLSKEYEKYVIKFYLGAASLGVRNCRMNGAQKDYEPILDLSANELSLDLKVRPDSLDVNMILQEMKAVDKKAKQSAFPVLMGSKDDESSTPLFSVVFKHNPLSGHVDEELNVKLKPMEIIFAHETFAQVAQFFIPKTKSKNLGELSAAAGTQFSKLSEGTRMGLQHALEVHRTLGISIDLDAPLILLPQSMLKTDTTILALELGRLQVSSNPVSPEQKKSILDQKGKDLGEREIDKLKSMVYDKFNVHITSLQVLLASSLEEVRQLLAAEGKYPNHLLEPVKMLVDIESCVVADFYNLASTKVFGSLPDITFNISEKKLAQLASLGVSVSKSFSILGGSEAPAEDILYEPDDVFSNTFIIEEKGKSLIELERRLLEDGGVPSDSDSDVFLDAEEYPEPDSDTEVFEDAVTSFQELQKIKPAPPTNQGEVIVDARDLQKMIKNIKISAQFSLGKVVLNLKNEGALPGLTNLARIVIADLGVIYTQRTFDMTASLTARALEIENLLNSRGNFLETERDSQPFLSVNYQTVQKQSPEFLTVHEGLDQNIAISLGKVFIGIDPVTVVLLGKFFKVLSQSIMVETLAPSDEEKTLLFTQGQGALLEQKEALEPSEAQQQVQSSMRLVLRVTGGHLAFLDEHGIILGAKLASVTMDMLMQNQAMTIHGIVGDFTVGFKTAPLGSGTSYYDQIVETNSEQTSEFTFHTYDKGSLSYPGYDMALKLKIEPIYLTYFHPAMLELAEYGRKFMEMQSLLDQATSAASKQIEAARTKALQATTTSKFHFDVQVESPALRLIRARDQPDSIVMYVGDLIAYNRFQKAPDGESEIDDISLAITSTNMKCGQVKAPQDFGPLLSEQSLLTKLSINLNVRRCLNPDYHLIPAMEISGKITTFELVLSESRLSFFLDFAEVILAAEAPTSTLPPAEPKVGGPEAVPPTPTTAALKRAEIFSTLDLFVELEAVKITLLRKKGFPEGSDALGSIGFAQIQTRMATFSDASLTVEIEIASLEGKDSRPEFINVFKDTITSRPLRLTYSQTPSELKTYLALTIDSPDISLVFDYWLDVADVVMTPLQKFQKKSLQRQQALDKRKKLLAETQGEGDTISAESSLEGVAHEGTVVAVHQTLNKVAAKQAVQADKDLPTTVAIFNVLNPVIKLYGSSASSNCDGLLLTIDQIYAHMNGPTTVAKVKKVEMRSCQMNDMHGLSLPFLKPFSLSFEMNLTPYKDEERTRMTLELEKISLHVSYRDIKVLMAISGSLSKSMANVEFLKLVDEVEDGEDVDQFRVLLFDDLISELEGETKNLKMSSSQLTALRRERFSRRTNDQKVQKTQPDDNVLRRQEIVVHIGGIDLFVLNDCNQLNVPLLTGKIQPIKFDLQNWSSKMMMETVIQFEMEFFNSKITAWEPIIEPWSLIFIVKKPKAESPTIFNLISEKRLELLISHTFLDIITSTYQLWMKDLDQEGTNSIARKEYVPYEIHNDLGLPIRFWSTNQNSPQIYALAPGQHMQWNPNPSSEEIFAKKNVQAQRLSLQIQGGIFGTVTDIPIDEVGWHVSVLKPAYQKVNYRVVADVTWESGMKRVFLRSSIFLRNETIHPVIVEVKANDSPWDLKHHKIRLAPHSGGSVPLPLCYYGRLQIHPEGSIDGIEYTVGTNTIDWKSLKTVSESIFPCNPTLKAKSQTNFFFRVLSKVVGQETQDSYANLTVRLMAPLKLENLLPNRLDFTVQDTSKGTSRMGSLAPGEELDIHEVSDLEGTLISLSIPEINFHSESPKKILDKKVLLKSQLSKSRIFVRLNSQDLHHSGVKKVSVFSPFLFHDLTDLSLSYCQYTRFRRNENEISSDLFTEVEADEDLIAYQAPAGDQAPVTLFSYTIYQPFGNRCLIRAPNSNWSKPINFNATGSAGEIELTIPRSQQCYQIAADINTGEGKYAFTSVIKLTPRFLIRNESGFSVSIRQAPAETIKKNTPLPQTKLADQELKPFHFANCPIEDRALQLSLNGTNWTAPFKAGDVGNVDIRISGAPGDPKKNMIFRVNILISGASLFIFVRRYLGDAPFRIENFTSETLRVVSNDGFKTEPELEIPPRAVVPFVWFNPASAQRRLRVMLGKWKKGVDFRKPGKNYKLAYRTSDGVRHVLAMRVRIESSTSVLQIRRVKAPRMRRDVSLSLSNVRSWGEPRENSRDDDDDDSSSSDEDIDEFEELDKIRQESMRVEVNLEGLGLSIIDEVPRELLYLTMRDIKLHFVDTNVDQTVVFSINWIQMDDELPDPEFPVILYQTPMKLGKKNREERERERDGEVVSKQNLHFSTRKMKSTKGIGETQAYQYFTFLLQAMDIEISESFLVHMLSLSHVFIPVTDENRPIVKKTGKLPEVPANTNSTGMLYFKVFEIQPIQVNVTFTRSPDESLLEIHRFGAFKVILDVLSNTVGSIDAAPLALNALEIQHLLGDMSTVTNLITTHYIAQSIRQLHRIVGSVEVLGNPVGLFNNMSAGVEDFFYEPIQGLQRGPADFAKGMGIGTASLFKNSAAGLVGSASKVTKSLGKGLAHVTLDEEFQAERRTRRREKNRNVIDGATSGATSVLKGFAGGITGLVSKPIEGAQKEGAFGFISGMGKGLIGAVTKPMVGLVDGASQLAEGLGGQITAFDITEVAPVRLPRAIVANGAVTPYSPKDALGFNILRKVTKKEVEKYQTCRYVNCYDCQGSTLIITDKYLIMVTTKTNAVEWSEQLLNLKKIQGDRQSLRLEFTDTQKSTTKTRSVFGPDELTMKWLDETISNASELAELRERISTISPKDH